MDNTNTVVVTTVTPEATTTPVAPVTPKRKSKKGTWGKVGAPPKDLKFPRGAYTIRELVALQGTYVNKKGETVPNVCELTIRNYVTAHVCGYREVKKVVDGKKTVTRLPVPVTIVQLPKNAEKDTVGRPNYRYMSKAAFEANQKNLKKTPAAVTTPVVVPTEPVTV